MNPVRRGKTRPGGADMQVRDMRSYHFENDMLAAFVY